MKSVDEFDFEYLLSRIRYLANNPDECFELVRFRDIKTDLMNINAPQKDKESGYRIGVLLDIFVHDVIDIDPYYCESIIEVIKETGFIGYLDHLIRIDNMKRNSETPPSYGKWVTEHPLHS